MADRRMLVSLFKALWIYFLIMWGYIAVTIWVYPSTQYLSLSEYVPIPQNLLAVVSFAASFAFYFLFTYFSRTEKRGSR